MTAPIALLVGLLLANAVFGVANGLAFRRIQRFAAETVAAETVAASEEATKMYQEARALYEGACQELRK